VTALAFRDVACIRGGRTLFADLTFGIAAGEALVVTGSNGTGKSSLLRVAAGLLAPAAGTVMRTAHIALMAEHAALDPERTLAQALGFWAALDREPHGPREVTEALDAVALAHLAQVPVRLLSTGQRRRAALARVLVSAAPVWLLDEPANGFDLAAVERLEALIAAHRDGGGCAVVATHVPLAIPGAATIELAA